MMVESEKEGGGGSKRGEPKKRHNIDQNVL
jgi:hypothetical protein